MYDLIKLLRNEVYQADQVVFSVHCHNDLGMGVANSLAAVRAGARQIECTINGIGERAGNAAMEEIVMAMNTRQQYFDLQTNIVTEQLYPTSRLLTQITGLQFNPTRQLLGQMPCTRGWNSSTWCAEECLTYEIMTPQSVGIRQSQLVLGKHSGRHALSERVKSLGFELNDVELNHIFKEFKHLADVKRQVFDEDIEALITNNVRKQNNRFELQHLTVTSGTTSLPTATITMRVGNDVVRKAGFGDGPVDAALNTIKQITEQNCTLTSYVVKAITGGTDAQGGS